MQVNNKNRIRVQRAIGLCWVDDVLHYQVTFILSDKFDFMTVDMTQLNRPTEKELRKLRNMAIKEFRFHYPVASYAIKWGQF